VQVDISAHNMQLWPGYVTSIRQHEHEILMCTEITHKVMRTDTVLDFLHFMQRNNDPDLQRSFKQKVLGLVVLTDYNNRTYRIDDVDYRKNPMSSFAMRTAQEITFAQYYKEVGFINSTLRGFYFFKCVTFQDNFICFSLFIRNCNRFWKP
jgi:aubergine-like protein